MKKVRKTCSRYRVNFRFELGKKWKILANSYQSPSRFSFCKRRKFYISFPALCFVPDVNRQRFAYIVTTSCERINKVDKRRKWRGRDFTNMHTRHLVLKKEKPRNILGKSRDRDSLKPPTCDIDVAERYRTEGGGGETHPACSLKEFSTVKTQRFSPFYNENPQESLHCLGYDDGSF